MAVPKRKTSKARRDKRRAQHAIDAPRVSTCENCGAPKQAHRVCPTCKTYRGARSGPARARPVARAPRMAVRVAIDALGGDHAPDEVVAGARAAASEALAPVLFAPAALDTGGVELVACTTR